MAVKSMITIDKSYEAVVETAKQNQADLIIVGSHGRKGLERLLMKK